MTVYVVLPWLLELDGCAVPWAPGLGVSLSLEKMILFFHIGTGYGTGNECELQELVHSNRFCTGKIHLRSFKVSLQM